MAAALPASELLDPRPDGRAITRTRTVRLGDVDQKGTLRLDATARYLQDVATDDVAESPLGDTFAWVVRRTMIEVRRPGVLDEELALTTFCSGTGRCWAERRTSIVGAGGASVEVVSLWVRIDPPSGRPASLSEEFFEVYGTSAGDRRVSSRLQLPPPADDVTVRPWAIRRVDIDPLNHVNNAAHWAALEEVMAERQARRRGVAEIEFLAALDAPTGPGGGVDLVVATTIDAASDGIEAWLVGDAATHTALRWAPQTPFS